MGFIHVCASLLLLLGAVSLVMLWRNRHDDKQRQAWIILTIIAVVLGVLFMTLL